MWNSASKEENEKRFIVDVLLGETWTARLWEAVIEGYAL